MRWPDRQLLLLALPILAIGGIVVGVTLQWESAPETQARTQTAQTREADYFLRNAQIRRYDESGQMMHSLTAAELEHFPDKSARLETVTVTRMPGPWTLQAQRGEAPQGLNELILAGEVVVQTLVQDTVPARLHTDALNVNIEERTLTSLGPIRMESATTTATANRMRASLDSQNLELIGEVRVAHKP